MRGWNQHACNGILSASRLRASEFCSHWLVIRLSNECKGPCHGMAIPAEKHTSLDISE